ncbi:hypothetical protein T459_23816 [Capsicum annuum]|uniref:H(+)-exporting diphosphatase n=1 Tax=Capsicum annuum TaxID=4072 RepID=A0A2G2YTT0_CAPAN|nr:hypothetical protein T459_23816 [Capsicum annuum]
MKMLSTTEYVLTMDIFGLIADNAGGIVEMSQQITDVLDAIGDTSKATTKGFAIGSTALASFLDLASFFLFSAYTDEVAECSRILQAVISRTTQEIVNEDYKENPNYSRCVFIIVFMSLRVMIKPEALAIISSTVGSDW